MNKDLIKKYYTNVDEVERLLNNIKNISESLFLKKEEEEIILLVGFLHNITEDPIDFLYEKNNIYNFTNNIHYIDTIKEVIYHIGKDIKDEQTLKYLNILNDAKSLDKIDLLKNNEVNINNVMVNKNILQNYIEYKVCEDVYVKSDIDKIICELSKIYGLKFKYSFYTIENKNYIETIFNNIKTDNETLKNLLNELKLIMIKYLKNKIGEKYHGW